MHVVIDYSSRLWKSIDGRADKFEYDFSIICQAVKKKQKKLVSVMCIINLEAIKMEKNAPGMLEFMHLKELY